MTVGVKSIAAVTVGGALLAIGATRHVLEPGYLTQLSPTACFAVALVASLAVALVGIGWRFGVASRIAVTIQRDRSRAAVTRERASGGEAAGRAAAAAERAKPTGRARLAFIFDGAVRPRELPGVVQRTLVLAGFAAITLAAVGNHAAARIVQLPDELAAPSPAGYCMPKPAAPEPTAAPPPQLAEQPGCALVKRAFALGYTRSLGSCAPKAAAAAPAPLAKTEVCTRRRLDEPMLHYGYRRVAGALGSVTSVAPIAAAERRVDDVRTHIEYLDGLVADIRHAITGSPHAAHHIWITLPDPHPGKLRDLVLGAPRCSQRFADLPLWPAWQSDQQPQLVEHVLGQLLFATRFGTTASCSDYTLHWDASPDICRRLAADPVGTLDREGALGSVRAVLDRRKRQLEIGELATRLGRRPPVAPPPATAIASLACFVVAPPASAPTGQTVQIDGNTLALREIHVAAIRTDGDGPIDVYLALAALLGGPAARGKAGDVAPAAPDPAHPLLALDPLVDLDPFGPSPAGRTPLQRAELREVYPFELHLHGFVDAFRRGYLAQRGRL